MKLKQSLQVRQHPLKPPYPHQPLQAGTRPHPSPRPYRHRTILFLLFVLLIFVRLPTLDNPPYDYDAWRQTDTEAMALNLLNGGFRSLAPELNYEGPAPNPAQLEVPLTPFLIALLYKAFGEHILLARSVPLLLFMGSVWFVYRIACRLERGQASPPGTGPSSVRAPGAGVSAAQTPAPTHASGAAPIPAPDYVPGPGPLLAAAVYGLLPLSILYSRAVMPEAGALFFYTGAFWAFAEAMAASADSRRRRMLALAACLTALAVSQKIPTVFVGIPMLWMAFHRYRTSIWRQIELWLFAAAALLPPNLYYRWAGSVAESRFVDGIAAKHILPEMFTAFRSGEAAAFFAEQLPWAFTWTGLAAGAAGLLWGSRRRPYTLEVWTAAMVLELLLIVAVIRFPYYMIFFGPPLAILAGSFLGRLLGGKGTGGCGSELSSNTSSSSSSSPSSSLNTSSSPSPRSSPSPSSRSSSSPSSKPSLSSSARPGFDLGAVVAAVLLLLMTAESLHTTGPLMARKFPELERQAAIVRKWTMPGDLILSGADDPALLNASRRKGWRITNTLPGDPVGELKLLAEKGAAWFIPLHGRIDGDDGRLKAYLEEHYTKVEPEQGYPMYKLR